MVRCEGLIFYKDNESNKYIGIFNNYFSYPSKLGYYLVNKYNNLKKIKEAFNSGHIKECVEKHLYYNNAQENRIDILVYDTLDDILNIKDIDFDYLYIFENNNWKCFDMYYGKDLKEIDLTDLKNKKR